jgi:hypothetical protein
MGFLSNLLKGLFGGNTRSASSYGVDTDQGLRNIEEAVAAIFNEGYEIKHDVSVKTLGDYDTNYKFAHVVYDVNGTIKLAVLLVEHNRDKTRKFLNAKQACADNNIPCVHFFDFMRNDRDYVENRIRTSL